jgi:hypothetical protein
MSFPFLAYFTKMKVGLFKLELANKDHFVKNESIYHIQSSGKVDLNAWSVADVSLQLFFFFNFDNIQCVLHIITCLVLK